MKAHPSILDRERSVLLVIDLQESYRGKLANEPRVVATAAKLLDAAGLLGIPVVVTEQYPKGLGATRDELVSHLPASARRFEKTSFSCLGAPGLREHLRELGREQVVVAGIETHVCVSQTVHDLLGKGVEVHVPADAVGSRHEIDYERGLERMERAGAVVSTVEAALFELLERAGTPEFKAVQKLIL